MSTDQTFRTTADVGTEEPIEAIASTRNFQDEVRQWFTAMAPAERSAALGFEDDGRMMATLFAKVAAGGVPSCHPTSNKNDGNNGRRGQTTSGNIFQQHPPNTLFPPKQTADRLDFNETCDWEARIALEIIEKTWEEIMMVGEPNTSGVNKKEFVKNSFARDEDAKRQVSRSESTTDTKDAISAVERGTSEETNTENKTRNNEKRIEDDAKNMKFVSDAYRIPNEGVCVKEKATSVDAIEAHKEAAASIVEKSCEDGKEDEKGKLETKEKDDAFLGTIDESGNEYEPNAGIAAALITTSSPLPAIDGIDGDLQYLSDSNNSRRIAEVMDNTRCIFPEASEIAAATTTGNNTTSHELRPHNQLDDQRKRKETFITINPFYLNSVSGDELLVVFDEIMAMACRDPSSDDPCSFILPEETTSASWLDLVRSYASTDTSGSSSTRSIPLYMLLVCHFQFNLAKTYSERSLSSSDSTDRVDVDHQSSHKSRAAWLSALMTRIRELESGESIEKEKIRSKLASILPRFPCNDSSDNDNGNLENYLLRPFSVLTEYQENKPTESSEQDHASQEINHSIEDVSDGKVARMEDVSVTNADNPQDGDALSNDDPTLARENESQTTVINNSYNSSSGVKKGKKKKKKKKRRGGGSTGTSTKPQIAEKVIETEANQKSVTEDQIVEQVLESLVEPVIVVDSALEQETKKEVDIEKTDEHEVDPTLKNVFENEEAHAIEDAIESHSSLVKTTASQDEDNATVTLFNADEEETISASRDKSESEAGDEIDLLKTDDSVSIVPEQPKFPTNDFKAPQNEDPKEAQNTNIDDQEDQWETVEVRPRGRKKAIDKANSTRIGSQSNTSTNTKKKAPRTKEARARIKTRKMVREIIGGILDSVEDDLRRRRNASREHAHLQRIKATSSGSNNAPALPIKKSSTSVTHQKVNSQKNTLRDILVRGKLSNQNHHVKSTSTVKSGPLPYSERAKSLMQSDSNDAKKNIQRKKSEKSSHITGSKTNKALRAARASPADQNTLPTIASTNSAFTPSVTNVTRRKPGTAQSSNSSDSESAESKKPKKTPSDPSKYVSLPPPLPTLLSPGNNNSTSSSVASSLDAPHAGHHGNKSHQSENDVGCHLLSVCDRLSREIDVFMKRRETALAVRRHERGLVLAALEKTLGLIWPGNPTVEMYGSCATNLDLPSSDLDVVVCGLDRPYVESIQSPTNSSSIASNSPGNASRTDDDNNREDESTKAESHKDVPAYTPEQRFSQHQMTSYQMQMMYGHMSLNAERVLRLAMELEHQPWAVHVKAIPTASVPVIKILADPARLQGAIMNGNADWLVQQPIHGQSPQPISPNSRVENSEVLHGNQKHMSHYSSQQSSPLWRGADVVNGLLKVDITFEGPEHGGIGSTEFSKKVVDDFANETTLPAECTPQVQVLMVLKELLAQRRSNEPFSGGLSSYALLLLVISMIGERKIIREELEKTERQRRVVASGGGNAAPQPTNLNPFDVAASDGQKHYPEKSRSKNVDPSKPQEVETNYSRAVSRRQESTARTKVNPKEQLETTAWKEKPANIEQAKPLKKAGAAVAPNSASKSSAPSSWATIARSKASSSSLASPEKKQEDPGKTSESKPESSGTMPNAKDQKVPKKPSSFADAVAKGKSFAVATKKIPAVKKNEGKKRFDGLLDPPTSKLTKPKVEKEDDASTKPQQVNFEQAKIRKSVSCATTKQQKDPLFASPDANPNSSPDSSGFPQGFHDVIEVLCSGETTPGKLLMHFLLFYGQHFESQSTAIDYSKTHQRDPADNNGYSVRSNYMLRRNAGSYDPVTGMYTVDPIVVYDPLEGAENNNVARSCFAWSSIRWVFAQSYMTLSSAAEQNASDGSRGRATPGVGGKGPAYGHDESGNVVVDPSSPLLELLLSF